MKTLRDYLEAAAVVVFGLGIMAIFLIMVDTKINGEPYKVTHNTNTFYLDELTFKDIQDAKELFASDSNMNQLLITNGRDTVLNLVK
jgi:hypothetical protein